MQHPISTFPRFVYLNSYAFLLLFMGVGVVCVPLYRFSWWYVPVQAIIAISCWKGAASIFNSWNDKKRKYTLLMTRNAETLRPDTFTEYMQAPCGRLLARVVMRDLGRSGQYKELKQLRKPFWQNAKESCRPRKTVIYKPQE
ncbi:MAG: hypothetical protein IJP52_00340 [Paludibacteraceae bacterium]|nr:hypothetical protein [Paludibacteraceae bacterium]